MMLRELYDLAQREGLVAEPGFQPKAISYVVVVGQSGKLRAIVSTLTPAAGGKEKPRVKAFSVPQECVRTSAIKAQFLWDNAKYVFGVNVDRSKKIAKSELQACREAFLTKVTEAAGASKDHALDDVATFLRRLATAPWTRDDLLKRCGAETMPSNANFAFRHESDSERLVSDRAKVRAWWATQRQAAAEGEIRCLVTGEIAPPIDSHPKLKKLGGQSSGVALVSFNDVAFESYGLSGNENAPIGRPAAEAVAAALNRLLDHDYPSPKDGSPMPARSIRIAEDTAVLYWSRNEDAPIDLFGGGIDADPVKVRALYEAPHGGRPPVLDDESPFLALAISSEMARAKVRGWFQTTLGVALRNVRAHFEDLEVASVGNHPMPLWQVLAAVSPLGERKRLPPDVATATFASVLEGRAYPRILLASAVQRERVAPGRSDDPKLRAVLRSHAAARAAVIKAYLARARRKGLLPASFPEVTSHMDTTSTNAAYRLGRLFATLEKLQEEAFPGTNTTIRDRFFGAASATPVTVFPRLVRGAQPHLGKVRRPVFFEKLIQEIVEPVASFPAHLSLEEQGLFALGYYHQRQDFFTKKDDAVHAQ